MTTADNQQILTESQAVNQQMQIAEQVGKVYHLEQDPQTGQPVPVKEKKH